MKAPEIPLSDNPELDEREWLRAAATNPAFDFLRDTAEDIYTTADGKPHTTLVIPNAPTEPRQT